MSPQNATIKSVDHRVSGRGVPYVHVTFETDDGKPVFGAYVTNHPIGLEMLSELNAARRGRRVRVHTAPDHGGVRVVRYSPPRSRFVSHTLPSLLRDLADRLEDGRRA